MRPRKARLPDPAAPELRAWVIPLGPAGMHREVCAFLRTRGFLTVAALATWSQAGYPGWRSDQSEMPLRLRLRLAERLTITSPLVRLGWCLVSLLPLGALVTSSPRPGAQGIDSRDQLMRRALLASFERALVHEWWRPASSDIELLTEYERLRETIAARATRYRTVWQRLGVSDDSRGPLLVHGKRYKLPAPEVRRRHPNPKPSEAAVMLLQAGGHGNERSIRHRLSRARRAREVRAAWDRYHDWLRVTPRAQGELDEVLPSMTRALTRHAAGLSSPPPQAPAGPSPP